MTLIKVLFRKRKMTSTDYLNLIHRLEKAGIYIQA
jgi:hypothetical protein